jgi:3-oxoacyl-(acyl-carrier-protein) synthase
VLSRVFLAADRADDAVDAVAGLEANDVDYVNAHATSTPAGTAGG